MKIKSLDRNDMKRIEKSDNFSRTHQSHKSAALYLALLVLINLLLVHPAQPQDIGDHNIISVSKNPHVLDFLQRHHFDLLMQREGRIYAVVGTKDLLTLQQALIPYTIETTKFPPYTDRPHERQATHGNMKTQGGLAAQGGLNGDFHSYWETEQELRALADNHPERANLHIIGTSLEGRNIYALKISDRVGYDEDEGEIVFFGCHHAREWISVEVPLLMAKHLLEHYGSDNTIKTLVDNAEIWIVPIVNPDGLEYSIHFYRYWRKNRRLNQDGTYGVDLNRNYGYKWGLDDVGSSPNTNAATYRGTGPFSEPETQIVRDFVEEHDFQALVSYHNYTQIIIYPWGYTNELSPDADLMGSLAQSMAERIQPVNGRWYRPGPASGLYHTNGDTTDWAYGTHGIPSFTIELPPPSQAQGGFFNAEEDIQPIFAENLQGALFLIDWAIQAHDSDRIIGNTSTRSSRSVRIRQQTKLNK
jgi:murein tripeptide amidase MpaA